MTSLQRRKVQWADTPLDLGEDMAPREDVKAPRTFGLGPAIDENAIEDDGEIKNAKPIGITPALGVGFTDDEVENAIGNSVAVPTIMDENLGPGFSADQIADSEFDLELGKLLLGMNTEVPKLLVPADSGFGSPRVHDDRFKEASAASPITGQQWNIDQEWLSVWKVTSSTLAIRVGPHRLEPVTGMLKRGDEILALARGGIFGSWLKHSHGWSCCVDRTIVPQMLKWKKGLNTEMTKALALLKRIKDHNDHRRRFFERIEAAVAAQENEEKKKKENSGKKSPKDESDAKVPEKEDDYPQIDVLKAKKFTSYGRALVDPKILAETKAKLASKHLRYVTGPELSHCVEQGIACDLPAEDFENATRTINILRKKLNEKLERINQKLERFRHKNLCYMTRVRMPETPIYRMRHVLRHFCQHSEKYFSFSHLQKSFLNTLDNEPDEYRGKTRHLHHLSNGGDVTPPSSRNVDSPLTSLKQIPAKERIKDKHSELKWILSHLKASCRSELEELREKLGDADKFKQFASECIPSSTSLPLAFEYEEKLMQVMCDKAPFFYTVIFQTFDILFFRCRMSAAGLHPNPKWIEKQDGELDVLWYEPPSEAKKPKEEEVFSQGVEAFIISVTAQERERGILSAEDLSGPILEFYANKRHLTSVKPFPPILRAHDATLDKGDSRGDEGDFKQVERPEPFLAPKTPLGLEKISEAVSDEKREENSRSSHFREEVNDDQKHTVMSEGEDEKEKKKRSRADSLAFSMGINNVALGFLPKDPTRREFKYLLRLLVPNNVWDTQKKARADGKDKKTRTNGVSSVSGDFHLQVRLVSASGHTYGRGEFKLRSLRSKVLCNGILPLKGAGKKGLYLMFNYSNRIDLEAYGKLRTQFIEWERQNPGSESVVPSVDKILNPGSEATGQMNIILKTQDRKAKARVVIKRDKKIRDQKKDMEIVLIEDTILFFKDGQNLLNRVETLKLRISRDLKIKANKRQLKLSSRSQSKSVTMEFRGLNKVTTQQEWTTMLRKKLQGKQGARS